jgi:hypothetical protein
LLFFLFLIFLFISSEWLFEMREGNEYENIVHEERPGGFNWDNPGEQ